LIDKWGFIGEIVYFEIAGGFFEKPPPAPPKNF
jgi:hypothetical protein